jgi:hypothetical protein
MNAKKTGTRGRPAAKATAKAATRKPATKAGAQRAGARAPVKGISVRANARQSYPDKDARRPEDNNLPSNAVLSQIRTLFLTAKETIEDYAQHLRPLDRKRLNGVGMKKMGFIDKALELALDNEEFLPHWLTLYKFSLDDNRFLFLEEILALAKQVEEMLWNITIESSDILYTDALEFYNAVQEGAKRRIDAAKAPYNLLRPFFSRNGSWAHKDGEEPTERQVERDFKAFLHGRRDGEVAVVNLSPKVKVGRREVIDKKFSDSEQFKATEEAEIKE